MSAKKKTGGRGMMWAIGIVVGLIVLLGGTWVGAHFAAGDQVPTNASVEGVAIGGLSPAEAEQKLKDELIPTYATPVTIGAGEASISLDPLESGLSLDYEKAVRSSGGGSSWNPAEIWRTLTGGDDAELPRVVDEDLVKQALEAQSDVFAAASTDATLAFEEGSIARTDGAPARELDVETTLPAVVTAFQEGAIDAKATIRETAPAISTAMVEEAVKNYAEPAVSGPITVTGPNGSFQITPGQVAAVTTFEVKDGGLVPVTDAEALMELTAEAQSGLKLATTKDASYTMVSGIITVVPSVGGSSIDAKALATALQSAASETGEDRTAAIEVTKKPAEFTTEQAEKLKPTEIIGEFTTSFPYAAYRNTNLSQAAASINGSVLLPGEVFSLNDTLGQRTAANGYVDGYVINGGVLVKESGGGISQSSTTLFNAAFFAGYEDVEHKPHSLYFSRYPAGREATIYYGNLDMRFRNNTEFPAYIQGYVNKASSGKAGTITFKIWSQKTWDKVESTELVKSDFYSGSTRTVKGSACEPQAPIKGFSVSWKRLFYKGGTVVKSEDWFWKYSAGDRIVCE